MRDRAHHDIDSARLRPHLRSQGDLLERYRRERNQARILDDVLAEEVDGKPLPLKQALTKPGDPRKLRGLPVIGRGVSGAIPGSSPEGALIAKAGREERYAA